MTDQCHKSRVSVQGVKSLGGHFVCLYQEFDFCEILKKIVFLKSGKYFYTFNHFIVKSLQKKIAQIYYYDPQSAGINMQSPQSDLTPWTLTLQVGVMQDFFEEKKKENQERIKCDYRCQKHSLRVEFCEGWILTYV